MTRKEAVNFLEREPKETGRRKENSGLSRRAKKQKGEKTNRHSITNLKLFFYFKYTFRISREFPCLPFFSPFVFTFNIFFNIFFSFDIQVRILLL